MTVVMAEIAQYTSGMPDQPDVPDEIAVNELRNKLGPIIEKARYFDGFTYVLNRGKRVAAIVPVELAEVAEKFGDFELLITHLRSTLESRNYPEEDPESGR
jgi:prevent-host-death family protein